MLFIWIVPVVFVAAIANAAVFISHDLSHRKNLRVIMRGESPKELYWEGAQCRKLHNSSNVSLTLGVCMQLCKDASGCTALNYQESPTSHCDLRNCEDPRAFPDGSSSSYQAYTRIRDVHDCFDQYEDCPRMESMGECDRNSTWRKFGTVKMDCKRSCGECRKCREGFFNLIGSNQCLKQIDNVDRNWEESIRLCEQNGLRMPEAIHGDTEELRDSRNGYDNRIDFPKRAKFWLNGRGNGRNMVLQHTQNVLRNVSCICSPEEHCKTNIGTNQCLTTSNAVYEPTYCLNTNSLLCEENLEAPVPTPSSAPSPALAPSSTPAPAPSSAPAPAPAPAPTPCDNCHNKWRDWICQRNADLGHCTKSGVMKNCEKTCDKGRIDCPDCPKNLIWNECKRAFWDPACPTVCRKGTTCCHGPNGGYCSTCHGGICFPCPSSRTAVAGCGDGFTFDSDRKICVRVWRKRMVV